MNQKLAPARVLLAPFVQIGAGLTMRVLCVCFGVRIAVTEICRGLWGGWGWAETFGRKFTRPLKRGLFRVQGNKRVDSETIGGYFSGTDQASINKGVKDLYATGLFSDVRVRLEGRRPGHHNPVTENNVINRVAFEGNSEVKTEKLQTEIQSKIAGAL